ncbi:MAG: radical SAM protein [Methanosarcina sp.]|jgi:biotin synthase-related radical SAM superfamily protein
MDTELSTTVKADLLSIGSVRIDPALLPAQLTSLATAGPGAGGSSIFFRSGKRRVRLTINELSPLRAVAEDGKVVLIKGDNVIARGLLEHPLCHCPEQAYITLSEKCVYDCQFCPVPKMQGGIKDSKKVHRMVEEAYATGELKAISLTSGVAVSPEKEVQRVVDIVKQLKREYDLPVGVSVYPTKHSSERLYAAGACEIKYNVETMNPEIFRRVCPDLSLQTVLDSLENAVDYFGRNRVSSNFIIGLGESDETVRKGLKQLTDRCVIPILRPISPHPLRKDAISIYRPSADRLLRLGGVLKEMLDCQSLCTEKSQTMCLLCTGCDLTPHRDL